MLDNYLNKEKGLFNFVLIGIFFNYLLFYVFRYYVIVENESSSYSYHWISFSPLDSLLESVIVGGVLTTIFIFFVYAGFSIKIKQAPNRSFESHPGKISLLFLFFLSLALLAFRFISLGDVAGAARSSFGTYFFFIGYVLPAKLLYISAVFIFKSNFVRLVLFLLYSAVSLLSGMKGGVLFSLIIFLFIVIYDRRISFTYLFLLLIAAMSFVILVFPFLAQIAHDIRLQKSVSLEVVHQSLSYASARYNDLFLLYTDSLFKRLSSIEYMQAVLAGLSSIDRDFINPVTFIIHVLYGFLPSFLEYQDFYLNHNANQLISILFFGVDPVGYSGSQSLNLSVFVFYGGVFAPFYCALFSFSFGYFIKFLAVNSSRFEYKVLYIYFIYVLLVMYREFPVSYIALSIKEMVVYIFIFRFFVNRRIYKRC